MVTYTVKRYRTGDGREPITEWLSGLKDRVAQRSLDLRFFRVEQGLLGDHKSLSGGLWELRVHYGPGYRVYFTREGNTIILLLCAGDKSSQSRDIEIARQYLQDWRSR